MSGFQSPKSGAAALVFLILYTAYTLAVIVIVTRLGWKTVYSLLLYYGLVRFGCQLCGVVYSAIGVEHWQWLIGYLVLGAQGYFALILAAFRFIIKGQREKFGHSWLAPSKDEKLQMMNLQNSRFCRFYGRCLHGEYFD
jgi:ABC-type multidrug transport system permease subunit